MTKRYKKIGSSHKTYIVFENEGFGFMEDPIRTVGIAAEFDTEAEAQEYIDKNYDGQAWREMKNPYSYSLVINTGTNEGTKLALEFNRKFDKELEKFRKNPNSKCVTTLSGNIIWFIDGFGNINNLPKGDNLESFKFDILDFGEPTNKQQ